MRKLIVGLAAAALALSGCTAPSSFTGYVHAECDPTDAANVTVCRSTQMPVPTVTATVTETATVTATPTEPTATPTATAPTTAVPVGAPGNWSLKFEDTFDSLNRDVWTPFWWRDCNPDSIMNKVQTCSSNVSVSGGELILQMSASNKGALMSSNPKDYVAGHTGYSYTTGYAEARVFFPGTCDTRISNWPAWWTTGQSWPGTGEIDIAEPLSGVMHSNYHSSAGSFNNKIAGCWAGEYHVYGVDRKAGSNDIYFDGVKVHSYATQDNNAPHYFVLNVGYSSGSQVYGPAGAVKVDYVRHWTPA